MHGNFYGWVHITANCVYFSLNVLKFELQYEWTPPRKIFCGYRILQLFCHNVEGAHDIKCSQKYLELKFCWFLRLGYNFTRGRHQRWSITGKHLCQSLFLAATLLKKTLCHRGCPVNFAWFLRTPFLQNTYRWLALSYNSCWCYNLQLYIAVNFQVAKRH